MGYSLRVLGDKEWKPEEERGGAFVFFCWLRV